jgi:UDP-glucose 4-epimerase
VFLTNLLARKPLCVFGDGRVVRDYIFVSDVADAMAGLVEKKNGYQVFNVGTQQGTSIEELIQALRSVSDLPIEVNHLPGRTFDLPVNILNCEKIRSYLGWQPKVTLHDGLRLTWDWFRSRGKETSGSVA